MKKAFELPTIEEIGLSPAESVMAGLLAISGETTAKLKAKDTTDYSFSGYTVWKGFGN